MSGLLSRNKGKRAEREVIELLQPIVSEQYFKLVKVSPKLQRNTLQSDSGGCDISGLEWLALEVKHCETFNLKDWWAQTVRQSEGHCDPKEPVLFYRRNKVDWRVRMRGSCGRSGATVNALVDISIEAFLMYFRKRLAFELLVKYGSKPKL
jgi:hypothetical protein